MSSAPQDTETPEIDGDSDGEDSASLRGGTVKALIAVLANVGVLTALLVYFGWVRSEQFANYLGIDEAMFQMSVDEYMRRSVDAVFILPLAGAIAGLAWVGLDQWWRRRRLRVGAEDAAVVFIARWLWAGAVFVFVIGIGMWLLGFAVTYIAWPLVCAAGLLLLLYSMTLRATLPGAVEFAPLTEGVLRGAVAILVAVALFWSAQNYAKVAGTELARAFPDTVATLPDMEVDSDRPLDIVAPGVVVSCFENGPSTRYHYRGLKYLESTGGNYFLISDGWTRSYGVVVILPIAERGLRYSFVSDYGNNRDADFPPCKEARARSTGESRVRTH